MYLYFGSHATWFYNYEMLLNWDLSESRKNVQYMSYM